MTSPKERRKAKRRAEALMEQAHQAIRQGNSIRAKRLSHRAIDIGFVNPRLWFDHGAIHHAATDVDTAESAYRQAITLAPTYIEAFVALARLQAERGKFVQAARLQQRALELFPGDTATIEQLAAYSAMLPVATDAAGKSPRSTAFTARTERFDWTLIDAELRATGMARLPDLLDADECRALVALWNNECFEHEVTADDEARGFVTYRFFARPLPPLVTELREEVYTRLADIANTLHRELRRVERFPPSHAEFVDRCRQAGQYRSTPILLHYPTGGANAPHQDIAGRVVFPFQLAVTLGPGCSLAGDGGALRLVDQRTGKRVREKQLETAVGDGAVFCTRERLVRVGGALAMQAVKHGVTECTEERFALGIPFHEHG